MTAGMFVINLSSCHCLLCSSVGGEVIDEITSETWKNGKTGMLYVCLCQLCLLQTGPNNSFVDF